VKYLNDADVTAGGNFRRWIVVDHSTHSNRRSRARSNRIRRYSFHRTGGV